MTKMSKEPRRCACGHSKRQTDWHCACGRWKPSTVAACETCSGVPLQAEPRVNGGKLTPDDVRYIRRAVANGYQKVHLAEMFGVTRNRIFDIVAGRAWRDVA